MTISSFHTTSADDKENPPRVVIRRDDDGDFWLKFYENGTLTEINVVMNPEQFAAFAVTVYEAKRKPIPVTANLSTTLGEALK